MVRLMDDERDGSSWRKSVMVKCVGDPRGKGPRGSGMESERSPSRVNVKRTFSSSGNSYNAKSNPSRRWVQGVYQPCRPVCVAGCAGVSDLPQAAPVVEARMVRETSMCSGGWPGGMGGDKGHAALLRCDATDGIAVAGVLSTTASVRAGGTGFTARMPGLPQDQFSCCRAEVPSGGGAA